MKKFNLKKVLKATLVVALFVALAAVNKNYADAAVNGNLTALTVHTGDEEGGYDNVYSGNLVMEGTNTYRSSTVALTTDCSGLIYFYFKGNNTGSVTINLYSDEACTDQIGYSGVNASAETVMTDTMEVPKAGTYYVQITGRDETSDVQFLLGADIYSSDDGTLKNGVTNYLSLSGYDDANYYKITVKKSGIIRVTTSYADGTECYADVDLYKSTDGKKKVVATGSASIEGQVFALSKGTYYIKLSDSGADFYGIKYKFSSISDKSGSKKSNAKAISYNKTIEGLILASDSTSKADWYKFTNSKKREIVLTFSGEVTGGVTLEFYGADGSRFGGWYISEYSQVDAASPYVGSYYDNSGTLPKGTYYMKVTKDSKDTCGYYSIHFK